MRPLIVSFALWLAALPAFAQETLGLSAPEAVVQSGLLKHILPRFSLKTGIRVVHDPEGAQVLTDAPPGLPVFEGGGAVYYLRLPDGKRAKTIWRLDGV